MKLRQLSSGLSKVLLQATEDVPLCNVLTPGVLNVPEECGYAAGRRCDRNSLQALTAHRLHSDGQLPRQVLHPVEATRGLRHAEGRKCEGGKEERHGHRRKSGGLCQAPACGRDQGQDDHDQQGPALDLSRRLHQDQEPQLQQFSRFPQDPAHPEASAAGFVPLTISAVRAVEGAAPRMTARERRSVGGVKLQVRLSLSVIVRVLFVAGRVGSAEARGANVRATPPLGRAC